LQNEGLLSVTKELIYLISCALNDTTPNADIIRNFDLSQVYKLAEKHSLEAISYSALEKYLNALTHDNSDISDEIKTEWSSKREETVKKSVMFGFEREKIFAFFEKEGIWYLPMKGLHLCGLYPVNGWRNFVDNDILFDSSKRDLVHDFMLKNGYTAESYGIYNHDIYLKRPFYNFEMHVSLCKEDNKLGKMGKLSIYYSDFFKKLIRNSEDSYEYHMSNEDFYIYSIVHSYMHHITNGTGLRTFVDIFVILKALGQRLNRDYIDGELEKMGILEFEERVRKISQKLFSIDMQFSLSPAEEEFLLFYSSSGTYGNLKNRITNKLLRISNNEENEKISAKTKTKYCFSRIFPSMDFYKKHYPSVYKCKILVPFVIPYRLVKGIFITKTALGELKHLSKIKNINKSGD